MDLSQLRRGFLDRMADALLGVTEPAKIARAMQDYVLSFDDLSVYAPRMSELVEAVLGLQHGPGLSAELQDTLYGLTFNNLGAYVQWFVDDHDPLFPSPGVVIALYGLMGYEGDAWDERGFHPIFALEVLIDAAITGPSRGESFDIMCEAWRLAVMQAHSWEYLLHLAATGALISQDDEQWRSMCDELLTRSRSVPWLQEQYVLRDWWQEDSHALSEEALCDMEWPYSLVLDHKSLDLAIHMASATQRVERVVRQMLNLDVIRRE